MGCDMAFLLSPLGRWIAIVAVTLALVLGLYIKIRNDGKTAALNEIKAANEAAMTEADKAERNVLNCPPGKWDREKRKCGP